jgi:protoporphyrinogen oxidase
MTQPRILVLGGGLSGLAAARALQESRADYLLLERHPTLGGLTRTAQVGDFCFDYTGHFLHLRRYASPASVPFADLRDEDWMSVQRHSCCYVANTMVTAPIQYHLGQLPPDLLARCVKSYDERPHLDGPPATSFRDYLIRSFGSVLADLFLVPQNEKTFAISSDRLCMNAVKRFFPGADDDAIRRGIRGEPRETGGYNASFWYPKSGGIEALTHGLARGLERCSVNHEVQTIDLKSRKLRTNGGAEFAWDALLTSIPLPSLCRMTGDPVLVEAGKRLTHSTTISVNIGVHGQVAPPLRDIHWIYVPDPAIPFYRVGVYSNISQGACSPGHAGIYAEVGLAAEELQKTDLLALQRDVLECLERLGWLDPAGVECVVMQTLHCAYVQHTHAAAQLLPEIFDRLSHAQVYPIGRYGRWDYTSMEDSIDDGLSTAARVVA